MSESVFPGVGALLTFVRDLSERPHRSKPVPGVVDGDRPLPLLCLLRGAEDNAVLTDLGGRLAEAPGVKVPFALVDADLAAAQVAARWEDTGRGDGPLLPLLDELRHRLAADRFGYRLLTRFRHYRLADWLTSKRLRPAENRNERATVTETLRTWHARAERPATGVDAAVADTVATQSTWMRLAVLVLSAWHRPLRFWLWSHRAPLFGREPRWLMRQPFMVPGHSTSFTGFAERLTAGRRTEESLEQIKKLLVHAFLQDLRLAYGSGTPRLRRWRRTAYAVVLLEGITEENGGWELLRLVNDVRNESTEHDPVLFVATAAAAPSWLTPKDPVPEVRDVMGELGEWFRGLPARRQSLRGDARFIVVTLPGTAAGRVGADDTSAWYEKGDIRPRRPDLLARRAFVLPAVTAIVLATAGLGGLWAAPRWAEDCLPSFRSGVSTTWTTGFEDKAECVGYSDSAAQLFGDDERMRNAQLAVFESNALAEELHEAKPSRPLVTVVYFSELTTPEGQVGSADANTEELTGILAQQHQANVASEQSDPLLRVVVANGGYRMHNARKVADELLAPLFADDPTVMGVLGMGRTVQATESAIGALGDLGIPVVATSLTGEGLANRSPMYFQLVAGNKRQAELVKAFAGERGITLYRPKDLGADSYLTSLVAEMGDGVDVVTWDEGQVGGVVPRCEANRIVFFAGRESEFDGFLDGVVECAPEARPVVLGADTVSRFVAQDSKRDKATYVGQAVSYVSLGSVVVTGNKDCYEEGATGSVTVLCTILRKLRSGTAKSMPAWNGFGTLLREDSAPWVGERVGLAFDGAGLFVRAVSVNQTSRDRRDPSLLAPNRAAIAQELRELTCPQGKEVESGKCYDGASGLIDFSAERDGRSRPLSVLRVSDIGNKADVPVCVFMLPASEECPNRP